ncbi:hypothetical protein [Kocuria sabuli]|uniref:hypothetical protein n=1 Tax=Kocuria sabuli TaxID=3071448 RepID=UPI0034D51963
MSHTPPSGPGPQGPQYNQQPGQYPHPGYGQQPPKKSKKKWAIGCGILALLGILLFGGCAVLLGTAPSTSTTSPGPQPVESGTPGSGETSDTSSAPAVTLKATATGNATAMYGGLNGNSNESFTTEFTKELTAESGDYVSLMVSNSDYDDGSAKVTCQILVNGEVVSEQAGTGTSALANCNTTLPFF